MHFVTQQQQQQQQQQHHQQTQPSINPAPQTPPRHQQHQKQQQPPAHSHHYHNKQPQQQQEVVSPSSTRFASLCKSSSQGALPKSLSTAHSSLSSSHHHHHEQKKQQQQQQRGEHKRTVSLNTTPMIKDIDIETTVGSTTTSSTNTTTTTTTTTTINNTTTTTTTNNTSATTTTSMSIDMIRDEQQLKQRQEEEEEEDKVEKQQPQLQPQDAKEQQHQQQPQQLLVEQETTHQQQHQPIAEDFVEETTATTIPDLPISPPSPLQHQLMLDTEQPQQPQQQQQEITQSSNYTGDRRDSISEEPTTTTTLGATSATTLIGSKLVTIQEATSSNQINFDSTSSQPNQSSQITSTATTTASITSTTSAIATSTTTTSTTPISTSSSSSSTTTATASRSNSVCSNVSTSSSNGNIISAPISSTTTIITCRTTPAAAAAPSISVIGTDEEQQQELGIDSNGFDSPNSRKSSTSSKGKASNKITLNWQVSSSSSGRDEDAQSKVSESASSDHSAFVRGIPSDLTSNSGEKGTTTAARGSSRISERAKKKSWYNVIYPNYKSRAEDFKKLFKEVPNDERLIVDYSCALQRDILVQGRLYVSQNYVCFHANIFSWETYVSIKWKDVTSITKEKTALVIPNAISIGTAKEKYFFATFAARDKSFLMLFRVWQNTLMNKQFSQQEIWKHVHNCYGEELGLTSDDEDYIDPKIDGSGKGGCDGGSASAVDTETDVDFQSAIDDATSTTSGVAITTTTTTRSNNNDNSAQIAQQQQSGNSSASSGSGIIATRKSKTKYFFSSSKSASATGSGSDNNKANNSSSNDNNTSSIRKSTKKMKSNAKELTLTSVKPTEQSVSVSNRSSLNQESSASPQLQTSAKISNGDSKKVEVSSKVVNSSSAATTTTTSTTTSAEAITKQSVVETATATTTSTLSKRKTTKTQRSTTVEEAAPTDVSDSSDSEANNLPFVPSTECTSPHEGRQILHTILPLNVDTLFNLLFSKSKFLTDFHIARRSTDLNMTDWSINQDGQNVRVVNVTVQLAASVGPKTSKVTEFQTMRECSKPGELYSIDINSVNAGIPYADSFSVFMHFCLARTVDDHTMLSMHAQIKYKKSIWGVVKGFIEKNTWVGVEDFFGSLLQSLQNETCIPPAKGKGRRPRRGTATQQIRPMDEATSGLTQSKCDILESQLLSGQHGGGGGGVATLTSDSNNLGISGSAGGGGGCGVGGGNELQQFGAGSAGHKQQQQSSSSSSTDHQHQHYQGQYNFKYKGLSLIIVLWLMLVLNVILLLKLWKLEERIDVDLSRRARMPTLAALKELPNTNQDWLELMRQQELSHETELRKWQQVLQAAIELLKKTEQTLAEVMFR